MISYTVDDIMSEGPCSGYTMERVTALWAGRETISPREIAALDIPIDDKIWALSRLLWRLSPYRAMRIARLFALEVSELWDCPDVVRWYLGTGDAAARAAARDAALSRHLDLLCRAWEVHP